MLLTRLRRGSSAQPRRGRWLGLLCAGSRLSWGPQVSPGSRAAQGAGWALRTVLTLSSSPIASSSHPHSPSCPTPDGLCWAPAALGTGHQAPGVLCRELPCQPEHNSQVISSPATRQSHPLPLPSSRVASSPSVSCLIVWTGCLFWLHRGQLGWVGAGEGSAQPPTPACIPAHRDSAGASSAA